MQTKHPDISGKQKDLLRHIRACARIGRNPAGFHELRLMVRARIPGYFNEDVDSAKAYDLKAFQVRGDKPTLNFPKESFKSVKWSCIIC
mmetsp:Transcript_4320/g.5436  ORF Transcript_4320/g.5436 Transcript_4320/m.5436 type:complete len:89 (-) Transcript_4320:222-488(-)